ncbi:MAG: helix-turn-helix transcriptional regulator [Rhizobiales bacterium]|nr:helix-turn-helix transcriptional regulator [Hyphomicrobiales bacterium]
MAPVKKKLGPLGRTFLKEWRDHAGLDQETAAARLNISRTLLSKIEGAKSPYTQRHLEAASEIYGRKPCELIAVDPSDPDELWSLWERAQRTEGLQRKQIISLLKTGLGDV